MTSIQELLGTKYPIIQAGMVWCSGWKLASASCKAGVLGVLGAGSMYPEVLKEHIQKLKRSTDKPYAVNLPLLYPDIDKHIETIIEEQVPIVITSAGNPAKYTSLLKENGIKVLHVIANTKFALKAENAGVDAIIAEGFEAGGHNGREETTTMCLIPLIKKKVSIPVIAAGGIGNGASMLAAMALGADGVQIGSRFAVAKESSAHDNYKNRVIDAVEGETVLTLKSVTPVRLIKNEFYRQVAALENKGATVEELRTLLGKGRAKKGIFEGDLEVGEIEVGQIAANIDKLESVQEIVNEIIRDYQEGLSRLNGLNIG